MSCRRGTPRNDCGCCKSLAEKVRELYQRCANAIKSINGINPDGANNFDILPGAGIQVNPRANGIEIVATGAAPQGMIETINNEGPDSDGNFAITAGSGIQINAGTNGFEIENISQGAVYTGVSPVVVNEDNEISLKDWVFYDSTDWSVFKDANGRTTEELLIILRAPTRIQGIAYIPKGIMADIINIQLTGIDSDGPSSGICPLKLENSPTIAVSGISVSTGTEQGSGYTNVWNTPSKITFNGNYPKSTTETVGTYTAYLYRRG